MLCGGSINLDLASTLFSLVLEDLFSRRQLLGTAEPNPVSAPLFMVMINFLTLRRDLKNTLD